MSDALDKAEAAVREASVDTAAIQLAFAAMELAKLAQQQPQHQACQHTPQQQFDAKKWWTIGGLAIGGGCVACALAMAFALASIAIAIGATCATGCLLVLRSMWRDFTNNR
jgi:hypothetical protein